MGQSRESPTTHWNEAQPTREADELPTIAQKMSRLDGPTEEHEGGIRVGRRPRSVATRVVRNVAVVVTVLVSSGVAPASVGADRRPPDPRQLSKDYPLEPRSARDPSRPLDPSRARDPSTRPARNQRAAPPAAGTEGLTQSGGWSERTRYVILIGGLALGLVTIMAAVGATRVQAVPGRAPTAAAPLISARGPRALVASTGRVVPSTSAWPAGVSTGARAPGRFTVPKAAYVAVAALGLATLLIGLLRQ